MGRPKKIPTNDLGWVEIEPEKYTELLAKEKALSMKNLEMPESFENIPYAQAAWDYIFSLGVEFNEKHFESIKSYCMACAMRDKATQEWTDMGMPMTIEENNVLKQHPLIRTIRDWNAQISAVSKDLGLIEKQHGNAKPKKDGKGLFN